MYNSNLIVSIAIAVTANNAKKVIDGRGGVCSRITNRLSWWAESHDVTVTVTVSSFETIAVNVSAVDLPPYFTSMIY